MQGAAVGSLTEVCGESMDEWEVDLIRRVLDGNAGAYDKILEPHLPMAWRLAHSQLHEHCWADDCIQEAAIRGWQKLANLKPGMPFRPWFLGIVWRQCLEERRKEARHGRWRLLIREVAPGHWLRSKDEDWLERSHQGAELRRAFAGLPRKHQVAIYLHLVEDLPQAEVALAMETSVSNIKTWIRRGKLRLREALQEEEVMDDER
jgi:RNA polymerase sigma-70 factor, ECF subfamily